jgi:hypothetical protein
MLIALRIIIILFFLALMIFMGHLSVRMEKRRSGQKYRHFMQDTMGSVWKTGGENFLPVPYWKPETDVYCERLRKKRNLVVIIFWLMWVLIVLNFIFF